LWSSHVETTYTARPAYQRPLRVSPRRPVTSADAGVTTFFPKGKFDDAMNEKNAGENRMEVTLSDGTDRRRISAASP
jgi:hypothetical protein